MKLFDSIAPYVWAAATALICSSMCRWWHPYCDHQQDGPGYFAWGFPLPYEQPTGASSLDFAFMPRALILDLAFTGIASFWIYHVLFRRLATQRRTLGRTLSLVGLLLSLFLIASEATYFRYLGHAVSSLGLPYDRYWSYRPAAIAIGTGHNACYF